MTVFALFAKLPHAGEGVEAKCSRLFRIGIVLECYMANVQGRMLKSFA